MTSETRTKKRVALRGSVSEIDESGTSFQFSLSTARRCEYLRQERFLKK